MLDELDARIISELTINSRTSFRELAKKVGASVATVANRVSKLERSGIIKGYTAVLNFEKLGYEITAVIGLVIKEGRLMEVQREIANEKNVLAVYDVTGEIDSIVIARFRNRHEMSSFIKKLLKMKYVERTATHVVLEVVKEDFRNVLI